MSKFLFFCDSFEDKIVYIPISFGVDIFGALPCCRPRLPFWLQCRNLFWALHKKVTFTINDVKYKNHNLLNQVGDSKKTLNKLDFLQIARQKIYLGTFEYNFN